jgi:hypothetical protein
VRFARSIRQGILGVIVLALLVPAACIIVDEKCSRGLDNVDITYEEWRDARK